MERYPGTGDWTSRASSKIISVFCSISVGWSVVGPIEDSSEGGAVVDSTEDISEGAVVVADTGSSNSVGRGVNIIVGSGVATVGREVGGGDSDPASSDVGLGDNVGGDVGQGVGLGVGEGVGADETDGSDDTDGIPEGS